MNKSHVMLKLADACCGGLVGAMVGILASAFGNLISSSILGFLSMVATATVLGAWTGRFPGAVCGGICGVLTVAFGSVIGGSATGFLATLIVCALLGGWFNLESSIKERSESEAGKRTAPEPSTYRSVPPSEPSCRRNRPRKFHKELSL